MTSRFYAHLKPGVSIPAALGGTRSPTWARERALSDTPSRAQPLVCPTGRTYMLAGANLLLSLIVCLARCAHFCSLAVAMWRIFCSHDLCYDRGELSTSLRAWFVMLAASASLDRRLVAVAIGVTTPPAALGALSRVSGHYLFNVTNR